MQRLDRHEGPRKQFTDSVTKFFTFVINYSIRVHFSFVVCGTIDLHYIFSTTSRCGFQGKVAHNWWKKIEAYNLGHR